MRRIAFSVFLSVWSVAAALAQGIYTDFAQNRIQFSPVRWQVLASARTEVYYYGNNISLAAFVSEVVSEELPAMENYLAYKSANNLQFMIFEGLRDYRQSNVGYRNPQWHSGGVTTIPNDLAALYFNGDYDLLRAQVRKGICEIMLREMIYGGTLQDRFDRMRSPALPLWFTSGLAGLLSEGWTADLETRLRDAFETRGFGNFNQMSAEDLILAGHSIWRYLVDVYGPESVPTIVFIARYTNSAEAGIMFHTKKELGQFLSEWREYYYSMFAGDEGLTLPKGKANVPARISLKKNTAFALDEEGSKVAMVTNDFGRYDIWLYELGNGKTRHLYRGGQKVLNQVADFSFPRIQWQGSYIWILTYEKVGYRLIRVSKEGRKQEEVHFPSFDAVSDFSFNNDGDSLLITGIRQDISDLWVCDRKGRVIRQITANRAFEHSARWLQNGGMAWIARAEGADNIFLHRQGKTTQLTGFSSVVTLADIVQYNDSVFGFLSDASGIHNAWICHAGYPGKLWGQTSYKRSIASQQVSSNRTGLGELLLINGHYTLYTSQLSDNPLAESVDIRPMSWTRKWRNLDSIFRPGNSGIRQMIRVGGDSPKNEQIDTVRRTYRYQTGFPRIDYSASGFPAETEKIRTRTQFKVPNPLLPDFIVTQSDNNTLGSYLFDHDVPGKVMRNPVIMPYVKVALSDLYRNTAIEAGARSNLDVTFTDYHIRGGYYGFRTDHEISGYRRSRKYDDAGNLYKQNISTAVEYRNSYPLDERIRLVAAAGYRRELIIVKASEKYTLDLPETDRRYLTGRLEMMFDNTASLGLNQLRGFRGKMAVNLLNNTAARKNISYLSADLRHYHVWRNRITLASRLTAAYNLGSEKVAWYVGGVENWTARDQLSGILPTLDRENYPMQMWVSNLRGFYRGARTGSSHMVINSELRLPLLQMLRKKPIQNEFFRNFTITFFADAGTAFIGKSPADPENPFNTVLLSTPNYSMSVTSRRNPWLFGTGAGVRTRVLGYFLKYDYARGLQEGRFKSPMNYISLGLDF